MKEIKLLDCTLRDGGYINDWNFGHNTLVSVFERLIDAGVDFLEIGFLDERREFNIDHSIMPNTDSVKKIYGRLDRHFTKVLGMIDYGTCGIENISDMTDSFLDGIRVIFKKHLRREALDFCLKLKKKGYIVFAQLVSVTSYSDEEMLDLIKLANNVRPYAVSIVDTYGLMHQNNLQHYFSLLDQHLSSEISIGYHGHNNFQMAYANSISMMLQRTQRNILVDGTLYGMGKGAGNAPIELLARWMNDNLGKNYHISQMLEAVDVNIKGYLPQPAWGYSLPYFLAASNDCHPNYVQYLLSKRTLSIKSVNDILKKLKKEKKLLYDRKYIELQYQEYQMREVDDKDDYICLKKILNEHCILLLGPGANIRNETEKVNKFILEHESLVISVNFIDEVYKSDILFLTNSKRYLQLSSRLSEEDYNITIIATSNITKTSGKFDYTLRYADLVDLEAEVIDNPLFMFFRLAERLGLEEIYLAGFDGYNGDKKDNYVSSAMEHDFDMKIASAINLNTRNEINKRRKTMTINFITSSRYE